MLPQYIAPEIKADSTDCEPGTTRLCWEKSELDEYFYVLWFKDPQGAEIRIKVTPGVTVSTTIKDPRLCGMLKPEWGGKQGATGELTPPGPADGGPPSGSTGSVTANYCPRCHSDDWEETCAGYIPPATNPNVRTCKCGTRWKSPS